MTNDEALRIALATALDEDTGAVEFNGALDHIVTLVRRIAAEESRDAVQSMVPDEVLA